MGLRPKLFKYLLLLVPFVAESTIATPSATAATFARSVGQVFLSNFSHDPRRAFAEAEGDTVTFSKGGNVSAVTGGEAVFDARPGDRTPTSAKNFSEAEGKGSGDNYWGEAISAASVAGFNFHIKPGETFKFHIDALLTVIAGVEEFDEAAIADGSISFAVIDRATDEAIDTFTITSYLNTSNDDDSFNYEAVGTGFELDYSANINTGGWGELIRSQWFGRYSRTFEQATKLTLLEVKENYAYVKAPEPGAIAGLLLVGATAAGATYARRRKSKSLDA